MIAGNRWNLNSSCLTLYQVSPRTPLVFIYSVPECIMGTDIQGNLSTPHVESQTLEFPSTSYQDSEPQTIWHPQGSC